MCMYVCVHTHFLDGHLFLVNPSDVLENYFILFPNRVKYSFFVSVNTLCRHEKGRKEIIC
jgi:hypothetical protein